MPGEGHSESAQCVMLQDILTISLPHFRLIASDPIAQCKQNGRITVHNGI